MSNLETQNSQDNCVEGGSLVILLFCRGEQPSQWKMAKYGVAENPVPTDTKFDSVTSPCKTYRVFLIFVNPIS